METVFGRTATISDTITDGVPGGRIYVIRLQDGEPEIRTAEDVQAFLSSQEAVVKEKMGAAKGAADPCKAALDALDAVVADKSQDAETWKSERLEDPAKVAEASVALDAK